MASPYCAFNFLALCFLSGFFLFIAYYFSALIFKGLHRVELFSADTLVGGLWLSFNVPAGFLGHQLKGRIPPGITTNPFYFL